MKITVKRRSRGYAVTDENEKALCSVKKKGREYIFEDDGGMTQAVLRCPSRKCFEAAVGTNELGRIDVTRSLSGISASCGVLGWQMTGDRIGYDFRITEYGFCVVKISRVLISLSPCFTVEIANDGDMIPAVMFTIAADLQ